ncbi:MAG: IS21/IS408/IS1162 family transposase [Pleomorphochaeta sp.]
MMDYYSIIKLKQKGFSNRKVSKMLSIDRKTIARYWNKYVEQQELLKDEKSNHREIQEKICTAPTYDSSTRKCRKFSDEMDHFLNQILEEEVEKCKVLGQNKQYLTYYQIYELMLAEGFDIGLTTVSNKIKEKRHKARECFIKQEYDYGDRLEYDFGEVKLVIDGEVATYHLAVLSSPGGNFRWAYLYKNQKKDVFMDSHVQFFEMIKGVYKEVVYDNMRNVVSKFIGKNEKELNKDLINLSLYYGFEINVTNCFSGNEKGYVENSVKVIRNKVFAKHYKFKSFEEAREHLRTQLLDLNKKSKINEEKKYLLPHKPKLELADITMLKVNKYSFVQSENNFYSVPEYLVGKTVNAKIYYDHIEIYVNNCLVCKHKKIDGFRNTSIDINHYLNTFIKKPGALKNSLALKSKPRLKSIYDEHFSKGPKIFIDILRKNKEKNIDELIEIVLSSISFSTDDSKSKIKEDRLKIDAATRTQTSKYNNICIGGNC